MAAHKGNRLFASSLEAGASFDVFCAMASSNLCSLQKAIMQKLFLYLLNTFSAPKHLQVLANLFFAASKCKQKIVHKFYR